MWWLLWLYRATAVLLVCQIVADGYRQRSTAGGEGLILAVRWVLGVFSVVLFSTLVADVSAAWFSEHWGERHHLWFRMTGPAAWLFWAHVLSLLLPCLVLLPLLERRVGLSLLCCGSALGLRLVEWWWWSSNGLDASVA